MKYLTSKIEGDILVLNFGVTTITDRLAVDSIASEWIDILAESELHKMIIDFSSVEFISSDLLGELLDLRTACEVAGVSLKLCCLSRDFESALELTQMSSMFKTYHSQRSAIERFNADNFLVRQEFFARYASETETETSYAASVHTPSMELFPAGSVEPFGL